MFNIKPEVLSPAGSAEALEAAVRSGADAVYLGSKQFSARRNAENFDNEELKAAAEYCRIRGVKTYLALNIMIKDDELSDALSLAEYAQDIGIDAVIVQDLGLALAIHKALPDLELHASTQMSVHSPAALSALKDMGFSRVVVSREMSGKFLREFCEKAKKLGIETEAFVHGALCMSVSGQCLLSAMLGERSGNRGLCAGPCRLPFKAPGGTGYDLSLKDLSLLEHINELSDMGVASLKIEGRMKRPEYIAAATAACRSAVDTSLVPEELSKTLGGVFSRSGFTSGYFTRKLGKDMFGIRTKDDVTASKETFSYLHGLYRAERQNVPISISAQFRQNEPLKLTVCDGVNTVNVSGDIPASAQNKAASIEAVKQSLEKLGGTPYFAKKTEITLDSGLFISNAQLNSLRREAVNSLNLKRAKAHEREKSVYKPCFADKKSVGFPKIIAAFNDVSNIPQVLSGVEALMLPAEKTYEKLPEGLPLIADIPRWSEDEKKLSERLEELKKQGFSAAVCHNLSVVAIAQKAGLEVIAGAGLNICNSHSLGVISSLGAKAAFISAEARLSDIAKMQTDIKKGIFAFGRLPLMTVKNCPLKNGRSCDKCDKKGSVTDRKDISFPIRCRGDHAELLNSADIYLADRLSELSELDFIMLSFYDESPEEVIGIIESYKKGASAPQGCTRGLYYRGVI